MPFVRSNGARIFYRVVEQHGGELPEAEPLILLHGYTASSVSNWEYPGFVSALAATNRLVLLDFRGHGQSEKFLTASAYSRKNLAGDVLAVMDDIGVPRARLFGYSMGSMIAAELLVGEPSRFTAAILGGMGVEWPQRGGGDCRDEEPPGFKLPSRIPRSPARTLQYLSHTNPIALRAVYRGVFSGQPPMDAVRLPMIRVPVLAIAGTRDRLSPGTRPLPRLIPDCRRVMLPGRGHISALADPAFKAEVIEFLATLRPTEEQPGRTTRGAATSTS